MNNLGKHSSNNKNNSKDINEFANNSNKGICKIGGLAAIILILYSLETMIQVIAIGGPPTSALECFEALNSNRLVGLLRLDIITVFIIPLYYLLFYSIYIVLRHTKSEYLKISTILSFIGVTLFLATPSAFSLVSLSDKYAAATSDIMKNQLLAAGEALIASDMWHGTGAIIGGIILQSAAVFISVIMLKSRVFGKVTAWVGILTHGLDLLHIILGFYSPAAGTVLMAVAGPLYLIWFPLIGQKLLKVGREGINVI